MMYTVEVMTHIVSGNKRNSMGANGVIYRSKEYATQKKNIREAIIKRGHVGEPIKGNVSISGVIVSNSDLDNSLKTIQDCLEGLVYENDKQIRRYEMIDLVITKDKKKHGFSLIIKNI